MSIRKVLLAAFCGLACALGSINANAHELIFETFMDGPSEAPPNSSPGTGYSKVTIDLDMVTMRVEAQFQDLLGTTSAAHIHAPTLFPNTSTANVATQTPSFSLFPLGVTFGSFDQTFDMTLASSYRAGFITANGGTVGGAFNALIDALENERAYFNIHTSTFQGGEIRGFYKVIPEPSTVMLIGCGGLALALYGWRRRVAA
ncbi:MAG: CHRD domain-containing protein [Pirellulales bacterium]|nr:CHRD domain-containing protein [Pirellulales bacterium]